MEYGSKMAAPTKIEFAVQMVCDDCEQTVKKALNNVEGIKTITINRQQEQVIVETTLPSSHVKSLLEKTGKKVALTGQSAGENNLGAAVVILEAGNSLIKGVVRFIQSDNNKCIIEGTIDGLPPGNHAVCIHQYGDISNGCTSCGPVFGNLGLKEKVEGIITDLKVGEIGRGEFRVENQNVKVWDIIGRSLVVHQGKSFLDSSPNKRLSCGIIARSAGIFENTKKICACDGTTIWDEKVKEQKPSL